MQAGHGKKELLDSYNLERRPVGQATVDTTDVATKRAMRLMTLRSPITQALRNQAAAFVINSGMISGRAFQTIGQLDVSYAASPVVGEHHSSIWTAEVGAKQVNERPRLSDWYRFGKGPGPGDRVPDLDISEQQTLFDLLQGTHHVLLLFDGGAATAEGYKNMTSIAERVARRYGEQIDVHIVAPMAERPDALTGKQNVVLDPQGALHEHFGCGSEGLYVIRPDGYVGFRSQPAEESQLLRYLETIFSA